LTLPFHAAAPPRGFPSFAGSRLPSSDGRADAATAADDDDEDDAVMSGLTSSVLAAAAFADDDDDDDDDDAGAGTSVEVVAAGSIPGG
jgi:hypothetical protein